MSITKELILVGWDSDLLELVRHVRVRGYVAPQPDKWASYVHIGDDSVLSTLRGQVQFLLAMDQPSIKANLAKALITREFLTLQSADAFVCPTAQTKPGSIFQRWVYIGTGSQIGHHVKVNVGAAIHHEVLVGDYCTIGPGARILGRAEIGVGTFVGAAAVVLPRVQIAQGAMIGAGAVVAKDVGPGQLVKGNPAR